MGLYKYSKELLSVSAAANTDQTGATFTLGTNASDNVTDVSQGFQVLLHLEQADGSTSPTSKLILETSRDGVNWAEVVAGTTLSADGSKTEIKEVPAFAKFLRARSVLTGGGKPNHTANVALLSNAPFSATSA